MSEWWQESNNLRADHGRAGGASHAGRVAVGKLTNAGQPSRNVLAVLTDDLMVALARSTETIDKSRGNEQQFSCANGIVGGCGQ